jgi:aldehyde:ferredoxin oxidoreductase
LPKIEKKELKKEMFIPNDTNAKKLAACSDYKMVIDSGGFCLFGALLGIQYINVFEYLEATTGLGYSPQEYMAIGRRIQTLRQLFNLRQGIKPVTLVQSPRASGIPPLTTGPNKRAEVPINEMVRAYWRALGWDEYGVPSKETIIKLGLEEFLQVEATGESHEL